MKSPVSKSKTGVRSIPGSGVENAPVPNVQDWFDCIATAAYYKAEARGFRPGRELDDWLEAEADISAPVRL